MPPTGDPLARRYRRLLFCHPRAYRRARADEMVGVLLDAAPPGRTRPTAREAADLIRHGLRCRLGRPASRTVGVWATLAAVICGLFTAALATRAAWETSAPPPGRAETAAVFAAVLPGHDLGDVDLAPALFTFYSQPLTVRALDNLLLGDGGEYQRSEVVAGTAGTPRMSADETLALAQRRLRETGWQTYAPTVHSYPGCVDKTCAPAVTITDTTLLARRGDTVLQLHVASPPAPDGSNLSLTLNRSAPPAVLPAGIAGGLLGAALGWLVFGWASRRTEAAHPARGAVSVLLAITLFLWWAPVLLTVPSLLRHHRAEPHPAWHPLWEWLGQPAASLLFVVGAASALLGLALAAVPRRTPLPTAAVG
ncbi:hypothetical protein V6U77_02640 [Micromonospora sp. CPCC 205546]|uniref:hypothetical protein n=1 Tax=Micromonospora sp. CPCC 205546 TaxID=3122397 RepID=UPI002FF08312